MSEIMLCVRCGADGVEVSCLMPPDFKTGGTFVRCRKGAQCKDYPDGICKTEIYSNDGLAIRIWNMAQSFAEPPDE